VKNVYRTTKLDPKRAMGEVPTASVVSDQASKKRLIMDEWNSRSSSANQTSNVLDAEFSPNAALTPEQKKHIRDYWDYYNKAYADALVKDF
jgi:hypothetical protein